MSFHIRQIAFAWHPAFICLYSSATELYWINSLIGQIANMPPSRLSELLSLAEQTDGLVTAREARDVGIVGSMLAD